MASRKIWLHGPESIDSLSHGVDVLPFCVNTALIMMNLMMHSIQCHRLRIRDLAIIKIHKNS